MGISLNTAEREPNTTVALHEDELRHSKQARHWKLLAIALLAIAILSLLPTPVPTCFQSAGRFLSVKPKSFEERAREILSTTPLIDGHVDLPYVIKTIYGNHIDNTSFTNAFERGSLSYQVDLKRLREGQSGGAFWSVYAPCPKDGNDFSDENYARSVQYTLNQVDVMARLQRKYSEDFSGNLRSAGALPAFRQGKLVSPLGIEGLHQIGNKAANLRMFYELGVRYCTLTHNCHNRFADAAIVENPTRKSEPLWGGVSPLGRRLVREMNRIGMIVDLSHVSDDTMLDVLGASSYWSGSKAPVIFSHSSAWSLCPHPRNVKDHVLQLVKKRNSLVMVNIAPDFISCVDAGSKNGIPAHVPANSTLQQVAKHIIYIGELIGYDHVGIGTDFDGIPTTPRGLEDVRNYPDLVSELLRQGLSDLDIAKVVGRNALRVWRDVEAVASKLQEEGEPSMEDE